MTHIAMMTSEMLPFARTGGLGDVLGSLPFALAEQGAAVSVFMPFYRQRVPEHVPNFRPLQEISSPLQVPIGNRVEEGRLLRTSHAKGVEVFFISHPFFERPELYGTASGDYPDNAERFAFFQRAAIGAMCALNMEPDIVHVHDWQTALIPVYLKTLYRDDDRFRATRSLLTIHNIGHQGLFPKPAFTSTGLDWSLFIPRKLEYWGKVGFLKGGLVYADAINTVSQRHAQEILTPEFGMGLEGVLRERQDVLFGIANGIDYGEWNPETDPHLPAHFSREDLRGKAQCKDALREAFGLSSKGDPPIIGMVSRLVSQKGIDLLLKALPSLMQRNVQLAILGTGSSHYHHLLSEASDRYRKQLGVRLAFNNAVAHLIKSGADMFLMPSRYEPCGLCQMTSLRYGTIPIVHATGGLDDTIEDFQEEALTGYGFKFDQLTAEEMITTLDRALTIFQRPTVWQQLISNAMACDFSWEQRAANEYLSLYARMREDLPLASKRS